MGWALSLALVPALIALALHYEVHPAISLVGGLMVFGALFAINSSLHNYLIVSYAGSDGVSLDVGFYYMANALGPCSAPCSPGWCSSFMVSRPASGSPLSLFCWRR